MKVGDSVPPKQVRGKHCPKCGDAVLKMYPTGYVIESSQVISKTDDGFIIRDNWHCPKCGNQEMKTHKVNRDGIANPKHEKPVLNTVPATDDSYSSDKSKHQRNKRR